MTKSIFLALTCGLLATVAVFAIWPRSQPSHEQDRSAPIVVPVAAQTAIVSSTDASAAAAAPVFPQPAREVIPDSDTTGLLLESPTVDELLDAANAGSVEPLAEADRAELADFIRSDPELRKHIRD